MNQRRRLGAQVLALVLLGWAVAACATAPLAQARPAEPELAASELAALVEAAENSYRRGDYDRAISSYQLALMSGLEGPVAQANLGSACFAEERYACASLAYHRAAALTPRDPLIRRRLEALREAVPEARASSAWSWLRDRLAFDEILRAMLATWLVLGLALLLREHARPEGKRFARLLSLARASAIVLILLALFGLGRWIDGRVRPTAVVVDPDGVELRSAPVPEAGEDAGTQDLVAGAWVRVIEARAGYVRLASPTGGSGWAPSSAIELIGIP